MVIFAVNGSRSQRGTKSEMSRNVNPKRRIVKKYMLKYIGKGNRKYFL